MKPSSILQRSAQHIMVFGDPKTGKSTLVAELLKQGFRLTWLSLDNGHIVLFKLGISPEQLDEQLNIIVIPDTKENPVAAATCLKIMGFKPVRICDNHGRVDCDVCRRNTEATWSEIDTSKFDNSRDILVFDHIGQLANSVLSHVMIKDGKKNDDDKPEWDHYRVQGALMDKFLTNVQQASFNVICITHTAETEMEDGSKKLVPLVGTVPFSRNVGKYFDHMVYTQVKNNKHMFGSATTFQNKVITGSRTDKSIEALGDKPSLSIFFDGTIPKPAEQGAEVAKKFLTTSQKVASISTPPVSSVSSVSSASSVTTMESEKKVDTLPPEVSKVSTPEPEKIVEKPAVPEPKPVIAPGSTGGVDRMALLRKLGRS